MWDARTIGLGGADQVLQAQSNGELIVWVTYLITCQHPHNFAVIRDDASGMPALALSTRAIECLRDEGQLRETPI